MPSPLDLFKKAYKKGAPKTGISKPKPIKAARVIESKTISPMASDAQSIMSEAYKKAHPDRFEENIKSVATNGSGKPKTKTSR